MVQNTFFLGALGSVFMAAVAGIHSSAQAGELPLQHERFMIEVSYGKKGYFAESPIELDYEGFNNGEAVLLSKPADFDRAMFESDFEGGRSARIQVKSSAEGGLTLVMDGKFPKRAGSAAIEACQYGMHVETPNEIENVAFVCGNPKATGFEIRIINLSSLDRAMVFAASGFRSLPRDASNTPVLVEADQSIKNLPAPAPSDCAAGACRSLSRSPAVVESSR